MAKTVGIGLQDFGEIIEKNLFYVDKTNFIKEWWESNDKVTLITRPKRFGKTLTMSMTEQLSPVKNYHQKSNKELENSIIIAPNLMITVA